MLETETHIGTLNYYGERNRLFRLRNSNENHPYYAQIGSKYARHFKLTVKKQLSDKGKTWVDSVFIALQLDLEKELTQNTKLECDYLRFHHFILKSHFRTYLRFGFLSLPIQDQRIICKNINWTEILLPSWAFKTK